MSTGTALVTLAVGGRYAERWHARCAPNWSAYAKRHGYDVVCLEEPLDTSARASRRSPAWQKLLVLGGELGERYERIVWVDADVLFNPAAPAITDGVPPGRVGAVDEYATPSREVHRLVLDKLYRHWDAVGEPYVRNVTARDYYAAWGLEPRFDQVVQTGVMVLSPAHHRELLATVYERYDDRGPGLNYEMRPLSWELLDAGVVEWIDPRFNYLWPNYKALHLPYLLNHPSHPDAAEAATRALHDVFGLHFAGSPADLGLARDTPPAARTRRKPATPAVTRTPVALCVYSRPDLTARVLGAIRAARPQRLLVFADGAREGEEERCAATRALVEQVDWDCEVETDFAATHLGLRERMHSGLDWVFSRTERAIVLEDDCVADPSFFAFCDELLERYRDDERVMAISGDDFQHAVAAPAASYRFSRYPLIWGWATWRRAWDRHDPGMAAWPAFRDSGRLEALLGDAQATAYWTHLFEQASQGRASWDYAWAFTCFAQGGLTALPTSNLVSNIGFRADATNTSLPDGYRSPFAALPTQPLTFPLRHPQRVERDAATDAFLEDVMFSGNLRRAFSRLRRVNRLANA